VGGGLGKNGLRAFRGDVCVGGIGLIGTGVATVDMGTGPGGVVIGIWECVG